MNAAAPRSGSTARDLLFPRQATGGSNRLGQNLRARGAVRLEDESFPDLSESAVDLLDEEIGRVVEGLLDVDLGDALVAGWRKYSVLIESARRTRGSPGSEEVVELAAHEVRSTYRPSVDLLVDELKVNTFEFDLAVRFELTGVAAVVRDGHLTALRGGRCVVTAALSLEGAQLVERHQDADLALVLPLRRPVSLLVDEG